MNKDKIIKLRVDAYEDAFIRGKAAAAGKTVSELILAAVEAYEVPGYVATAAGVEQLPGQLHMEDLAAHPATF